MTIDAQAATASDFAGFRCWTPESADQTISIEAVTASPAVFLATHGPLLIARTPVRVEEHADHADFDIVSEADVLKDFAQRRPVNGVLIMPVVGQSGTGKSHLVRWIREHLPERKDRRVVYIEKTNTNLSGVVNALLMGLEGNEFDVIREEVGKVVTDYDERRLPGELLAQLALSIEFSEVDESRPDARYRRGLVGQGRLSALLLDHVMYSRLVAPDGVVSRLAKELQHGRARGEAERRFGFEVDDFPMDLAEIESAGASAKNLMRQLVASDELRVAAVQLLNENLDQAVLRLANLTGGKLQNAMLDIRRALQKQGQEIVLLVEDFAVIQGVQRDLLDAITEVGVREGRAELAPIRTLMAVTRGYFDALAETVTTRAAAGIPYLYDLDVSVGDAQSQVSSEHIQDFAARYLNAARLGQAVLEDARTGGAQGEGEDWLPNACERCPFQIECHAAFGHSSDGHGLYPFNDQVLGRAVRSRSSSDVFNPRAVLGRVLRPVLESYYEDIPSGKFPPPAFARAFPLSPRDRPLLAEVVESLHLNDPKDHDRRVVLLEYWGGAPVQPGNLKEGIHRAFKLPPIDTFNVVAPRAGVGGDGPEPGGALPVRLARARTALENWFGRNDVLPQEVARQLRGIISSAVLARISWNDLLLAEPTKEELRTVLRDRNATGVRIEGAAGEGGQQEPGPANIRVDRNATTATVLGALLTRDHLGHWNFPGGPVQARRFQSLVDAWGARVVSGVRDLRGIKDDTTTSSAVAVSLVGALVLGIDGSRSRDHADLMRALLDDGQSLTALADAEVRPRQWNDLASRVLAARTGLVNQLRGVGGAAQGGGHVQLIDVDRLLVHVKASGADLRLLAVPGDAPPWLSEAARPLRERLDAAVDAQLSMLQAWADEVLPSFGGASIAPEVLSALEQALEEAVQMGVFTGGRGGMAADQQELLRKARKYAWSTLDDVRDALSRSEDDKMIRLKEAAADRGRSLGPIRHLATTSHAWLDGTSTRAATRLRDEAPEGGLALVEVLSGVERVIQQLQASAAGTPAVGTGPNAVSDDDLIAGSSP